LANKSFALVNAADPQTNELLHVRLFSTTTTALTEMFLRELRQKHDIETAVFPVESAIHPELGVPELASRFQTRRHGNRNALERMLSIAKAPKVVFLELLQPRRTEYS